MRAFPIEAPHTSATTPSNTSVNPDTIQAHHITLALAQRAIDAAIKRASELNTAVCLAVCDSSGRSVMTARMDGAPLMAAELAVDKAYTVTAFNGMPTGDWWGLIESKPELRAGLPKTPRLIIFPGGVPIELNGLLIGAIGAGGGSSEQDVAIAIAGAKAVGEST